jgi:hypothetical protein
MEEIKIRRHLADERFFSNDLGFWMDENEKVVSRCIANVDDFALITKNKFGELSDYVLYSKFRALKRHRDRLVAADLGEGVPVSHALALGHLTGVLAAEIDYKIRAINEPSRTLRLECVKAWKRAQIQTEFPGPKAIIGELNPSTVEVTSKIRLRKSKHKAEWDRKTVSDYLRRWALTRKKSVVI